MLAKIRLNLKNRAVSTIEYSFLIILIATVLIVMLVYFTRAFQGKWKQSADSLGYGLQYEPGVTKINTAAPGPLIR